MAGESGGMMTIYETQNKICFNRRRRLGVFFRNRAGEAVNLFVYFCYGWMDGVGLWADHHTRDEKDLSRLSGLEALTL